MYIFDFRLTGNLLQTPNCTLIPIKYSLINSARDNFGCNDKTVKPRFVAMLILFDCDCDSIQCCCKIDKIDC